MQKLKLVKSNHFIITPKQNKFCTPREPQNLFCLECMLFAWNACYFALVQIDNDLFLEMRPPDCPYPIQWFVGAILCPNPLSLINDVYFHSKSYRKL